MTPEERKKIAEERQALLAARGIHVKIRTSVREGFRTEEERLRSQRSGWVGRAADINIGDQERDEALAAIDRIDERLAQLDA